jgi:arginyl-tRNA synthetase
MQFLVDVFTSAFEAVAGQAVDPVVRRSKYADFQVEGALALGRRLGRSSREVAAQVMECLETEGFEVSVAGPGYLNVTVDGAWLGARLEDLAGDARLGVPPASEPELVTIDYSAPNVAKEMHVGNLRSSVIGDAIVRLLEWLGHDVRRLNHIGDWGTPFGMLLEHVMETSAGLDDLNGLYKTARVRFDGEPGFAEQSRARVVALQNGDPLTVALWRRVVAESEKYFLEVYEKLGLTLSEEDFVGESFYRPMLEPLLAELEGLGLLTDSEGAKCVFPLEFAGEPPIIVRKRDGGFSYSATDLASIRYRIKEISARRLIYVVGSPQSRHFAMVFAAAREAGWLTGDVSARHIAFGSVLGADGKMLRSRSGVDLKLVDLLDEAVARAAVLVDPEIPPEQRDAVARAVGIGAVKYADLSTDRVKDYVFDWDRMLAVNGDTAAYLQYTCVRASSILRRSGSGPGDRIIVEHPAERALALELLAFPAVISVVAEGFEFQKLTTYLFELAGSFNAFFRDCQVLKAPEADLRQSRLALCALTQRVLTQGLDLLGIEAPSRM